MQPFGPNIDGWYDVENQLKADLRHRAAENLARRAIEKAALRGVADFEAYREKVRANFMNSMGGLPIDKTPLNARVTGRIERDKFTIEKVIFESLPGYYVTAACYVPHNLTERAPAVIFVHGHIDIGKAYPKYQQVCCDLAANGFVALAIDPFGQGERLQYLVDGESATAGCTIEHSYAGFPFVLQGASVARHFIWDGIRAVDYLESRPDVDATRIGITGNSGGGTQTCLMMMSEPRLAAAIPGTFVMTLETMQKTGHPQDMEQIVRNCMVAGPDHDDFLTAMAPKPVLVAAVAYDTFPIEGPIEAVRRAKEIYALYGKSDNVDIAVDLAHHEYSDGLRQAAVNWFKRHLGGETPDFVTADPPTLTPEELRVTRSGQVSIDSPDATTIADLACEYLETVPSSSAASPEELRRSLDETLGISAGGDRDVPIHPRTSTPQPMELEELTGATWEKIWFFSAADIAVSGILAHPPDSAGQSLTTTLLLLENGTDDIEARKTHIAAHLRRGERVFVFDVRGTGGVSARVMNTGYDGPPFHGLFNGEYRFSCDAMMLGVSLLGLRAFDVLRAFDFLRSRDDVKEVAVHGVGSAAPLAYFTGAFEPGIKAVCVEQMLHSYRELCATKFYDRTRFNLKTMPWGILRVGDFVDFLPCFEPRPVTFIAPLNARGETIDAAAWGDAYLTKARERGQRPGNWEPIYSREGWWEKK